jgi:plasmid segregation protein ParM
MTTDTGRESPLVVGLDIGYSHIKVVTSRASQLVMPTAVAPADGDDWVVGDEQPGTALEDVVILPDGGRYLVGQAAIWSGRRCRDHLQWDTWWHSIPYRVLLHALRRHIPPGSTVVTGVPLHIAIDAAREPITRLLKQILRTSRVSVMPQGVAAAAALGLSQTQDHTALIDIGGRTTELVALFEGRLLLSRSGGVRLGILSVYEAAAAQLQARYGIDVDSYLVEAAARGAAVIRRQGEPLPADEIQTVIHQAAKPLADQLLARIAIQWPDRHQFSQVILCGGGSLLLADRFREWRRDLVVPPDPYWLNARGYLMIGQHLVERSRPARTAASAQGPAAPSPSASSGSAR